MEKTSAKVIPNIMDENDDVFIDNHNKGSNKFVKRMTQPNFFLRTGAQHHAIVPTP